MRVPLIIAAACAVAAAQSPPLPTLSVRTVATFDGVGAPLAPSVAAPGPFFRSELLQFDLAGMAAFAPVSLFLEFCGGACGPPSPPPALPGFVFSGTLSLNLLGVLPIVPWDGLGVFGAPTFSMRADATGAVTTYLLVPSPLPLGGLLPSLRAQAAALLPPAPGATSIAIGFGNVVDFSLSDPPPVAAPTAVSPSFFPEGSPTVVTLSGSALLRTTAVPVVRFTASNGGATALATNVAVVLEGGQPVIKATTPAFLGAPTNPPLTSAGRVDVTVDYAAAGLYDASPAAGSATTSAATEADPAYFVMQAFTPSPALSDVTPRAGPVGGLSGVLLDGASFLRGSTVVVDAGGAGESALAPCAPTPGLPCENVSGARLRVDLPAHAAGLAPLRVRSPDHLTVSPRETALAPEASFAYFDPGQLAISVGGATPAAADEALGTIAVAITGTCAAVGGFAALDPAAGPVGVRLGYLVDGFSGSIDVTPSIAAVAAPDPATPGVPGSFRIDLALPGLPPGLNPPGLSGAIGDGLTNAGVKHFQVLPAAQFGSTPHLPLAAIPGLEPGNRFTYRGPAPVLTSIGPNNVGRADGGQTVTLVGDNFFTQSTSTALATAATTTRALFGGFGPTPLPAAFARLVDQRTLEVTTPDASLFLASLPAVLDVVAENVDGGTSVAAPNYSAPNAVAADDFVFVPSLGDPLAGAPFAPFGAGLTLDTGTLAAPTTFAFGGSLTLPAGFTLTATGEAPLVLRVRGDLTLDGDLDLRGAAVAGGPYGRPAGAGAGGAAANFALLSAENPFHGSDGAAPASPLAPTAAFGAGGLHDLFGGGGGGGGMSAAGVAGLAGVLGGAGGAAYGLLPAAPLPTSLLDVLRPLGGAGGGAGGLGVDAFSAGGVFLPGGEPGAALYEPARNGGGGNGGGAVLLACDGVLTVRGRILVDGAAGGVGFAAFPVTGGGGGGGAGGAVVLQALQKISVAPTAAISALGGAGGLGGAPGVNDGGSGSIGAVRFAIPLASRFPTSVLTTTGSAVSPAADTTGF